MGEGRSDAGGCWHVNVDRQSNLSCNDEAFVISCGGEECELRFAIVVVNSSSVIVTDRNANIIF